MRKFAVILILSGMMIIAYAVYEIYSTNTKQKESLAEVQKKLTEENITIENFSPEIGEEVGILHIPKIDAELPIIEGTDEDE